MEQSTHDNSINQSIVTFYFEHNISTTVHRYTHNKIIPVDLISFIDQTMFIEYSIHLTMTSNSSSQNDLSP